MNKPLLSWLLAAACLAGCHQAEESRDAGQVDGQDTGSPDLSARGQDSGSVPDAATGDNSISGSVGGTDFNTVAAAYWIGMPDDAATTVIYLFDHAVACADIGKVGWDGRIPNHTQILEMKMFGLMPLTYKVSTSPTPAPGEAAVNYTLSANPGTPKESGASNGTVKLTALQTGSTATGAFALKFNTDHLDGSFHATFCAGGHEP